MSILIVGMCVLAQTAAPPATAIDASPAETPPPAAAPSDVARAAKVVDTIPDADKHERAQEYVSVMKENLGKVIKHLEEAREQKDVIKLNCVNEKLTTLKGLLKISEEAAVSLQEALARKDKEMATHEFSKISISRQKSEQLLAESEACVGELAVYAGETEVEVEIVDESDYDSDDITAALLEPPLWERPPAASPYQ